MWMHLVVVREPTRELLHHGFCGVELVQIDVVTLEALHEGLRHAVALWRIRWRRADDESGRFPELPRFEHRVAGRVVREPFDRVWSAHTAGAKALFNRLGHEVADHFTGDCAG